MRKVTIYVRDDQFKFLDNLAATDLSLSKKVRLLIDQVIWSYRRGFCSEHDLKCFLEGVRTYG